MSTYYYVLKKNNDLKECLREGGQVSPSDASDIFDLIENCVPQDLSERKFLLSRLFLWNRYEVSQGRQEHMIDVMMPPDDEETSDTSHENLSKTSVGNPQSLDHKERSARDLFRLQKKRN